MRVFSLVLCRWNSTNGTIARSRAFTRSNGMCARRAWRTLSLLGRATMPLRPNR
jgi:hypothetical protein